MKIRRYFEMNENEGATCQNLCNLTQFMFIGKFTR